jgi:hypothetical protein
MVLEEVLEIEISDDEAEQCGSPCEIVDMPVHHLSNQRPMKRTSQERSEVSEQPSIWLKV